MNNLLVEDSKIGGVWVVVQQGDKFVLCQEAMCPNSDKPRFGKQPGDFLVGAAETRESGETIEQNARRAMLEEMGRSDGYELSYPLATLNVHCQDGQFFVAIIHARLNPTITIDDLQANDHDSRVIGFRSAQQILNEEKPQRAGSNQALQYMRGLIEDGKIIQGKRYE